MEIEPNGFARANRWVEYSKAKDDMFSHTICKHHAWYVVEADDKKGTLKLHFAFVSIVPYKEIEPELVELPEKNCAKRICKAAYG